MANEFLISKWKLWFKFMDTKHRGVISREDIKEEEEAYAKAAHLEGKQKEEFMKNFDKLTNELVFHGKAGEITEEEFVEMTNNDFKADKEKYVEKMRKMLANDFEMWDNNKTGTITEDNMLLACKSFGLKDEAWIKQFFQAMNPIDGKLHKKEYVEAMMPFVVSEDSSVKDPATELFKSCPDI